MKIIHKLLNGLFLLITIIMVVSFFLKKELPPKTEILESVYQVPIQTNTNDPIFSFNYRNDSYKIIPQADYELWGLIISHNNIGKIGDIYHTEESVDLKDACVLWGENLETGAYLKGKYKSGSWTCYWDFKTYEDYHSFNENEVANNHLITADPDIQNRIRNLKIGNQIHIKGNLVNYENEKTGWKRSTSMTREDTGNGACEVIFVEELEVLKSSNQIWYQIHDWGKWGLLGIILLKIIIMVAEAKRENRELEELN